MLADLTQHYFLSAAQRMAASGELRRSVESLRERQLWAESARPTCSVPLTLQTPIPAALCIKRTKRV